MRKLTTYICMLTIACLALAMAGTAVADEVPDTPQAHEGHDAGAAKDDGTPAVQPPPPTVEAGAPGKVNATPVTTQSESGTSGDGSSSSDASASTSGSESSSSDPAPTDPGKKPPVVAGEGGGDTPAPTPVETPIPLEAGALELPEEDVAVGLGTPQDQVGVAAIGGGRGVVAGARTGALPFTGIEDALFPMLLALMTLLGGAMLYRQASTQESIAGSAAAAQRAAERHARKVRSHASGYGGALQTLLTRQTGAGHSPDLTDEYAA